MFFLTGTWLESNELVTPSNFHSPNKQTACVVKRENEDVNEADRFSLMPLTGALSLLTEFQFVGFRTRQDADAIEKLNESGDLRKILRRFKVMTRSFSFQF
jgi:hypothetical protein